jgi:hypothetical protein
MATVLHLKSKWIPLYQQTEAGLRAKNQ